MKTITLTLAATAIAMTGFAYAGEAKGPLVMNDAQLDHVVAGKKRTDTPGTGNDTGGGDTLLNYVYLYDRNSDGKDKYVDYDSGGSDTNTWTCTSYGTLDSNGNYTLVGAC